METMSDQVQERARYLDSLKAEGRLAGPLYGLPISLKDGFQVAGTQATLGLISLIDYCSDVNSPMVDVLLNLGAVLYVKTNIPQTLMVVNSNSIMTGSIS
jgi:amidase